MRIINLFYKISWVVLLAAAIAKMFYWNEASYAFVGAAVMLTMTQFLCRVKGGTVTVRRLVAQQMLGALALVVAGVLMFTHVRNEWMVAMFIGALIQMYTAFRIPQELDKGT